MRNSQEEFHSISLIEGIFQSVKGSICTAFRTVPKRIVRWFNNKLPTLLFKDPNGMLLQAKDFCHFCDRTLFGASHQLDVHNSFSVLVPYLKSDLHYLQFRYMARCLPHGDKPDAQDTISRLSKRSEYSKARIADFGEWFSKWIDDHKPDIAVKPSVSISNSGCLERTRLEGGQSSLYKSIISYQLARMKTGIENDIDQWVRVSKPVSLYVDGRSPICNMEIAAINRKIELAEDGEIPEPPRSPIAQHGLQRRGASARGRTVRNVRSGALDTCCINSDILDIDPIYKQRLRLSPDYLVAFAKSRLLVAGAMNLIRLLKHEVMKLCVMVTEERGGKFRSPCKSSVLVQIIAGLFRSILNKILIRDERIVGSLRTSHYSFIKPRKGKLIRSQDLSFATDLHPFALPLEIYQRMIDKGFLSEFPFAHEFLTYVFPEGGRILVEPSGVESSLLDFDSCLDSSIPDPLFRELFHSKPLFLNSGLRIEHISRAKKRINLFYLDDDDKITVSLAVQAYPSVWSRHIRARYDFVGTQLRGPSMGEPLAWPSLPLVTIYCFEKSHIRPTKKDIITCGDDGQFLTSLEENVNFNLLISQFGSVVSKTKDVLHSRKGIFVERCTLDGIPIGGIPTRMAFGLPSAKEKQTYYTVGRSVLDQMKFHKTKWRVYNRLMSNSRFYSEFELFRKIGGDPNLPNILGGLDLRLNRYANCKTYNRVLGMVQSYSDPSEVRFLSWNTAFREGTKIMKSKSKFLASRVDIYKDRPKSSWKFKDALLQECSTQFVLDAWNGTPVPPIRELRPPIYRLRAKIHKELAKVTSHKTTFTKVNTICQEKSNPTLLGYFPLVGESCPNYVGDTFKLIEYELPFNIRSEWTVPKSLDYEGNP
jgi:hypothetical protein